MDGLRWLLLFFGLLVIAGVYLYSRREKSGPVDEVLEPGDAIYIPVLWWHGVESLDPLNILVNYWWNDVAPAHHKPILALIHTVALMSALPADERDVWRGFFDHFAFQADGDPAAHLPSDLRDVVGALSTSDRDQVLAFVAERLRTLLGHPPSDSSDR